MTRDEAIDISVRLRTAMRELTSALDAIPTDDPLWNRVQSAFRLVVIAHLAAIERTYDDPNESAVSKETQIRNEP